LATGIYFLSISFQARPKDNYETTKINPDVLLNLLTFAAAGHVSALILSGN
jgi:hypothetical protein